MPPSVPPPHDSPGTPTPPHPFDRSWVSEGAEDADEVEATLLELDLETADRGCSADLDRLAALVGRLDLTSLNGDDTPEVIRTLCRRARRPNIGNPKHKN